MVTPGCLYIAMRRVMYEDIVILLYTGDTREEHSPSSYDFLIKLIRIGAS